MLVGSYLGGETPSSQTISARWCCGLDPARCWSRASADRRAPHTHPFSSPETSLVGSRAGPVAGKEEIRTLYAHCAKSQLKQDSHLCRSAFTNRGKADVVLHGMSRAYQNGKPKYILTPVRPPRRRTRSRP